ncbi:MAG: UDP-3-O-(3-hydroxymyristoyl)glucosamine N-acyltransferase [Candidatus Thiodiazotropha sp. DIVDIV]
MSNRLGDIAEAIGAELRGDPELRIEGVGTLQGASSGQLSFLSNTAYRRYLKETGASAVILPEDAAMDCPVASLITDNPYLAYARAATMLSPVEPAKAGIAESAVVADSALIDDSARVEACCVIGERVKIGAGVIIGSGSVIEADCEIGEQTRLVARVTLCHRTRIGDRCLIHPGAVLGADGFGLANDQGKWIKVPQLGRVWVGDDVEIGANTTVDRGALEDTILHDGVKLDNMVMIAHNVEVGEHTAMAGCSGIAGSTKVGRYCTVGGQTGLAGHLTIGDNVHFSGATMVSRSFSEPGYYTGNLPAMENGAWRKMIARLRHLDGMAKDLKLLKKAVKTLTGESFK